VKIKSSQTGQVASTQTQSLTVSDGDVMRSEAKLVSRLRAGDEAAFDVLVRMTAGRMLVVARGMLNHEQDAQDAVQEAFLSAFRSLEQFDGRSRLSTWLHRITVNACLMRLRTKRRRPETPIENLLPRFLDDGHRVGATKESWTPIESSGIETEEVRSLVRDKIGELPDMYRVVLLLRDVQELDTQETAAVLGISENAVKTRLHRARQALRGLLEPHFTEVEC